jgi:hypothetical protein
MKDNKESAVDWIEEQLAKKLKHIVEKQDYILMETLFEQAKAMEKKQEQLARNDSYNQGWLECTQYIMKHTKQE